jgi:hypothetical protein
VLQKDLSDSVAVLQVIQLNFGPCNSLIRNGMLFLLYFHTLCHSQHIAFNRIFDVSSYISAQIRDFA